MILFVYKNILRLKIKIKKISFSKINYILFIKKYLPRLVMLIIVMIVTTNNILAQNYSTEEYANLTLISTVVAKDNATWSEIIEEKAPIYDVTPSAQNYIEEQGNIQQLVIVTPFEEKEENNNTITDTSTDESSLVIIAPEDNESVQIENQEPITRNKTIEYIVQPGDILGKIAEKYDLSVNTILWENNLTWNSTIKPGQKLNILPNSGINHEVKSGDTVLAIAKKYQTEAEKIIAVNKLANSSDIQVGDSLFIPDGVKPTQVVSSYKAKATIAVSQAPSSAEVIDTGTKLLWPTLSHRITQYFSYSHTGLDIGDKVGNPIYAAEAGKVERAGWSTGYGYNVVINHGNGIKTLYGHSSKLLVSAGDSVSRGQTIALIGNTGWSTGPHLHMEVRVNEVRKNPLNYIK